MAIAEPESRPEFIHCYKLTENSLYAAVAIFDTDFRTQVLDLCPQRIAGVISYNTQYAHNDDYDDDDYDDDEMMMIIHTTDP